jgi:hypothetical protein
MLSSLHFAALSKTTMNNHKALKPVSSASADSRIPSDELRMTRPALALTGGRTKIAQTVPVTQRG